MIALAAVCLAAVIAYNFLIELFVALRNIRLASVMQLTNSVAFAALALGLMLCWQCSAKSVLLGYGGSCLIAALMAGCFLPRLWRASDANCGAGRRVGQAKRGPTNNGDKYGGTALRLSHPTIRNRNYFGADTGCGAGVPPAPYSQSLEVWSKVVPFAAWVLAANLLTNLFGAIDRYMIIHFSGESAERALYLVGNYHASRVVPLLLLSLATMLAAMITPHLSHDWEAGRRELAAFRLRLLLKVFGLGLFAAATGAIVVAPLLFNFAFKGKFPDGLAVFPWTLVYCCWFGMLLIVQNYLYCVEKARFASLALLGGLALNVPLNLLLLPRWGLPGAVLATAAANAFALGLICLFNRRLGFRLDDGARLVLVLPMVVCLGALGVGVCSGAGGRRDRVGPAALFARREAAPRRTVRRFRHPVRAEASPFRRRPRLRTCIDLRTCFERQNTVPSPFGRGLG